MSAAPQVEVDINASELLRDKTHSYCCDVMKLVLEHHEGYRDDHPGLQQAFLFDRRDGKHTRSPIVYCLPGRGRGKARVQSRNLILVYCPFCGQKQDPNAK